MKGGLRYWPGEKTFSRLFRTVFSSSKIKLFVITKNMGGDVGLFSILTFVIEF